jgi:hypothetical protein
MSGELARSSQALFLSGVATHHTQFRVGGVSVRVAGSAAADVRLVSSLRLFGVEPGISDVQIQVRRTSSWHEPTRTKLFDSGSVWRLYEDDCGFRFDFSTPAMGETCYKSLIVDEEFRHATLLVNDQSSVTGRRHFADPLDYPLDELLIMHRLTQEKAIELHACGIVRADGTGNLFVGHSGAGKSTTTRLWTAREDVEVLSDDRIIVRRDEVRRDEVRRDEVRNEEPGNQRAVDPPFQAAGGADEHGVVRLRHCSALPSNRSAQQDKGKSRMRMYGTPWHGEAMYASPGSAPLARIFILEHGQGNVLTRLSPSQAVGELFARSFVPFHRHEYVDSALEFLQEVVDAVPCYRYSFEPDQRAVDRILDFRD